MVGGDNFVIWELFFNSAETPVSTNLFSFNSSLDEPLVSISSSKSFKLSFAFSDLYDDGFPLSDLNDDGFDLSDLYDDGFDLSDL